MLQLKVLKGPENSLVYFYSYTPNYSQFMYSLNNEKKEKLINEQKMTSDGVSEETLNEIYELLYSNDLNDLCEISIFHDSTLLDVKKTNDSYVLNINKPVGCN